MHMHMHMHMPCTCVYLARCWQRPPRPSPLLANWHICRGPLPDTAVRPVPYGG